MAMDLTFARPSSRWRCPGRRQLPSGERELWAATSGGRRIATGKRSGGRGLRAAGGDKGRGERSQEEGVSVRFNVGNCEVDSRVGGGRDERTGRVGMGRAEADSR
jgi:hypothetical protein